MKISLKDQLVLTSVALVVVLALVIGFLIVPQFSKLAGMDQEIGQARADVAAQANLLNQRASLKNQAAETDAKALRLSTLVPDQADLPALIIELQDVAFAAGVELTALTPSDPVVADDATYESIPLDLTVQGTWTDTVDFLQRIPRLTRGIRTVEFTANVLDNDTDENSELSAYEVETAVQLEAYAAPSDLTTDTAAPATTN